MSRPSGVVLAFDFGLKRIGVASGQAITATASPLTVIHNRDGRTNWAGVDALFEKWRPRAAVVGLAVGPDGGDRPMTRACRRFARQLEARVAVPVHRVDERYTSQAARERFAELRRAGAARRRDRDRLDAVAAQTILESWLQDAGEERHDSA